MSQEIIDELDAGTTCYPKVVFRDRTGALATPSAVYTSIRCLSPDVQIRLDTLSTVSVSNTMEFNVTPVENRMVSGKASEVHRFTARAVYGINDELVTHIDFIVNRAD